MRRLSEARNEHGTLTHKMCCICFHHIKVEDLWTCPHGEKWDLCSTHGPTTGCRCSLPQQT